MRDRQIRPAWILLAIFLLFANRINPARPAENGKALQAAVDQAMQKKAGALVVQDVATGAILASHGLEEAAQDLARPGSTLKPFVLMALLETGRLRASEKFVCHRKLRIGSVEMDCTHPVSVGLLSAKEAIAYSCNSYVAQVARRISSAELAGALRKAGFSSPTGLVQNEVSGHVDRPATTEELQLEALGDWGIEVTPLELMAAYRDLASRLKSGDTGADSPVLDGLEGSVEYGMAHAAHVEGLRIAGKTGTAVSKNSAITHGFFAGYAPTDKPEIALVVYIERGRGGDAAAAAQPVFAAFAESRKRP
jgi:cell division protein FtsI/penicillin-binding protein 2